MMKSDGQAVEEPVHWVGSARRDLRRMPKDVRQMFGLALQEAQLGRKASSAKPLGGLGSAGVLEVVEDDDGSTYRAVYTVRFAEVVYVLHVFQKKSKHGRETPREDMELIRSRLADAAADYEEWLRERGEA